MWAKGVFWLPCAVPDSIWALDSVLRISVAFRVYPQRVELQVARLFSALLLGLVAPRPRLFSLLSIVAFHLRLKKRH